MFNRQIVGSCVAYGNGHGKSVSSSVTDRYGNDFSATKYENWEMRSASDRPYYEYIQRYSSNNVHTGAKKARIPNRSLLHHPVTIIIWLDMTYVLALAWTVSYFSLLIVEIKVVRQEMG